MKKKNLFIFSVYLFGAIALAVGGVFTNHTFAQTVPKDVADELSANQDSIFHFQKKINYPISYFSVNNLGELFIINTNNELKKLNENGDSVGVFNQVTKYGKLTYVNAQNPWRTILFYQNFSNIVLLDKYLNVVTAINLRKKNIFGVKAIAPSYDNNIWLFDEQENKLKKIDEQGKILLETTDLRLVLDSVPTPTQIIDRDGFVYLYDPKKGFYVFDYYGSYKNKLPFLNWKESEVIKKNIYGFDNKYFYRYSIGSLDLKRYPLPTALKNFTSIKIIANKVYFLNDNILQIYSVQ